ncbi:MAG: hypothetical protein ACREDR_19800 [Blastocatellia bacterium]
MPVISSPFESLLYGAANYSAGFEQDLQTRRDNFNAKCVSALQQYVRPEWSDFWSRFLQLVSDELGAVDQLLTYLDNLFGPDTAPEPFIDLMIQQWFGWTLIPDGYPLLRKRQLLANLAGHYQRRNTPEGIRLLLAEFGVNAVVTDRPIYWDGGSYYGQYMVSDGPLQVRVVIRWLESWDHPQGVFIGDYLDYVTLYDVKFIVTEDFIMRLVAWERVGGTQITVQWETGIPGSDDTPVIVV